MFKSVTLEMSLKPFKKIDDAFRYIEKIADTNIITCEDIEGLNSAWPEEHPDAYIYLHEFQEV